MSPITHLVFDETIVKMFWILLTLSLACADKLDRTYLPPPGSQYAGGRPEDIQAPLDYSEINYPTRPNYIGNEQIAIGIDRKGPKEILDEGNNINFAGNTFPQAGNVVSKTTTRPADDDYVTRSSIGPDYIIKQSSSESPDITKFYNGQNQQPNIIQNFPEKYIPNGQIRNGNIYVNTAKPITNKQYESTSVPSGSRNTGDLDGIISVPCDNSLTKGLNNGPCLLNTNSNQYLSTLSPMSVIMSTTLSPTTIPNYSENFSSNQPQNNVNVASATHFASTTKSPFNSFDFKRPERIQAKSDREAVILNYENVLTPEGYAYSFDTSNGIHGDESGIAIDGVRAKGSYSYIGDDGKNYTVVYTADENGFRPEGEHLPTSPPIPNAILKVIEKAYADKKAGIIDDGSYDENKYGDKKYQNNFYKPSQFKPTYEKTKINEGLNIKKNTLFNPNQQNVYLDHSKNIKSDVNIPKEQTSPLKYANNYYGPKTSSTAVSDDYKEIDDDAETDYQKLDNVKPISKNLDDVYKNNMFIINKNIKNNEQKNSSPTTNSQIYNEAGSPYYSSQNDNEFPRVFLKFITAKMKKKNTNETPKPFMTPYVLRNDDDEQQIYDSKEKIYDGPNHYFNDEIHQKYNNDNYPVEGPNGKEQTDINQNISSEENDDLKPIHNGYFYPKSGNSGGIPFKQFPDPNLSYATTYSPFEFSTRLSTLTDNEKYYPSTPEPTFRLSTIPSLTNTSPEYQTSRFSSYSPKSVYMNGYEETKEPIASNNYYPSTEKNIAIDIPKFVPSYSPNIDIMNSDSIKIPSSTVSIIGEDFSGPKRPQSFNPLTGYQY